MQIEMMDIIKKANKFIPCASFCSKDKKMVRIGIRRVPPPMPIPPKIPDKIPDTTKKKYCIFPLLKNHLESTSEHDKNKCHSHHFFG